VTTQPAYRGQFFREVLKSRSIGKYFALSCPVKSSNKNDEKMKNEEKSAAGVSTKKDETVTERPSRGNPGIGARHFSSVD
jgi:hypothetical protein